MSGQGSGVSVIASWGQVSREREGSMGVRKGKGWDHRSGLRVFRSLRVNNQGGHGKEARPLGVRGQGSGWGGHWKPGPGHGESVPSSLSSESPSPPLGTLGSMPPISGAGVGLCSPPTLWALQLVIAASQMQWTADVTKCLLTCKERGDRKFLKVMKKKQVRPPPSPPAGPSRQRGPSHLGSQAPAPATSIPRACGNPGIWAPNSLLLLPLSPQPVRTQVPGLELG